MSNYLNEEMQKKMRALGIITENEVITKQGDLYVAVNVIDSARRVVDISDILLKESASKRILKG
tara:strand:+ start:313 stop:504 length:192 start_codon:yes stop_codon:yes gene_type:complete